MKKMIPVVIIGICVFILCSDYLKSSLIKSADFKEMEVSGGEILQCSQDIPEGFYTIEVLEGPTEVGVDALDQGEIYHNYHVMKGSEFFLGGGKGKVKIMPESTKYLDGKNFEICQMGDYRVGRDIAEGTYQIVLRSKLIPRNSIGIFLWNEDEGRCKEQYEFKKIGDKTKITLKNCQILEIYRTVELEDKKCEIELGFRRLEQ